MKDEQPLIIHEPETRPAKAPRTAFGASAPLPSSSLLACAPPALLSQVLLLLMFVCAHRVTTLASTMCPSMNITHTMR